MVDLLNLGQFGFPRWKGVSCEELVWDLDNKETLVRCSLMNQEDCRLHKFH